MDFWLQLAWTDSTEVNSFTEVDMHTCDSLMLHSVQSQQRSVSLITTGRE